MAVESQLKEHLERQYPRWENGGELERMTVITRNGAPAKPSNISRRLRELAEAGEIERKEERGSVWYKATHGMIAVINNIPLQVFKEKVATQLPML